MSASATQGGYKQCTLMCRVIGSPLIMWRNRLGLVGFVGVGQGQG